LTEAYRKLRNTFRYMLGNLHDFDPEHDAVPPESLTEADAQILLETEELIRNCRRWYGEFAFHKAYRAIYDFAAVNLSAVYFDISKDRLYTGAPRSHARRSAQTAMYRILHATVRLLAPLISFTAEEVWSHMRRPSGAPESVHLALLPEPEELSAGIADAARHRTAEWARLMDVRSVVLKELELRRQEKFIGAPLEARVRITVDGDLHPVLERYSGELAGLFIVSEVLLDRQPGSDLRVSVERAEGIKCERCWKHTRDIGADPRYPTICRSCAGALSELIG
ncbi:MAG TPA: class I tRNA ligase family protein, partial [Bryobacteraceae bacterium]|nr:class I tRNA ligase family protein [Bryobacteraceae bacterium]